MRRPGGVDQAPATHRRFEALGTYVHVGTSRPEVLERAAGVVAEVLAEVDASCSRFRPDSDLERANAAAGSWVRVDPLLVSAVEVALAVAHETAGLVDPCLGRTLVWLGYDADLQVVRRRGDSPRAPRVVHPVDAWREVRLDAGAVRVPAGVALDLGATAKAWAADLAAHAVVDAVGGGVVVSVGGDVRILPDETVPAWPVSVSEHPDAPDPVTVWVSEGGVATSSTAVRRWRAGGVERHHLVDPRTGEPTTGPWRTVTATGASCVAANAAATAALVLGDAALEWLTRRHVDARLVDGEGRAGHTCSWPAVDGVGAA